MWQEVRPHWNPRSKKVYVWKCRKHSKEGPRGCMGRNLHEEDVHSAVVKAIQQTLFTRTECALP
ncbi:recombinase zinc beta ribbon domain-containing protein [Baileyella intestinalis]|uniref:recombinase zinc beta ribbon domain-containing protein n=1 Tax=Baileyella intestinalis TaxID=2606709 RepID=UPI003A8F0CE9